MYSRHTGHSNAARTSWLVVLAPGCGIGLADAVAIDDGEWLFGAGNGYFDTASSHSLAGTDPWTRAIIDDFEVG